MRNPKAYCKLSFDNMKRPQNVLFSQCFVALVIIIKKFNLINSSRLRPPDLISHLFQPHSYVNERRRKDGEMLVRKKVKAQPGGSAGNKYFKYSYTVEVWSFTCM